MNPRPLTIGSWCLLAAALLWFVSATVAALYAAEEALESVAWSSWQSASLALVLLSLGATIWSSRRAS